MPPRPLSDLWPCLTSFAALKAQLGKRFWPAGRAFNDQLEGQSLPALTRAETSTYAPEAQEGSRPALMITCHLGGR